MKKVLIFSGTTEGRLLAETLSGNGIPCIVSVATEYGEIVMPHLAGVTIHRGRMDVTQMRKYLAEQDVSVVVDATHPFATAVSENIKESLKNSVIPYLRLQRNTGTNGEAASGNVILCKDAKDCAKKLAQVEGNILLTTGSKDLAFYAKEEALRERLYVRVLPGMESLALCEKNGICGRQVIAMQGPFSMEMNCALIRQFGIQYLVTKESGRNGGFLEKIRAAEAEQIAVCVIGNPERGTEGNSFEEVCKKLSKLTGVKIKNRIALVGIGMGQEGTLTAEAAERIRKADYLFGAERLLSSVKNDHAARYPYYLAKDILPELERISGSGAEVVILFSGDTGFYSGCARLYEKLKERTDCTVRICPGISSVSYFAARTGYSYQDAAVTSIHGHGEDDLWKAKLAETIRFFGKTFVLMSGKKDVQLLGRLLQEQGLADCTVYTGYQLSYPEEQVMQLTPEACERVERGGLYICLILNGQAVEKPVTCGIRDDAFLRDKVPMTKEEIRTLSVCKLQLKENSVCYDIGSGTGSIAVEMAALSGTIQVYAIECKPLAADLIRKNKAKFHLPNLEIIEGVAPDCLLPAERTERPTHTIIGGSGGRLKEILDVLYAKNPTMRVVIDAISLETIAELSALKNDVRIEHLELIQVQVSRARAIGNYQLMQGENPIYICSFDFHEI